jgi:NAD(P)-dependent dehydrogenase (short-subunit alcohol dehydrogenase family)
LLQLPHPLSPDYKLNDKNKVALVTGCSRSQGIGFEVCRQLGQLGLAVFLTARDAGKAQALASTLRDEGLDVTGHALDISSANSTQIVIDVIGDRHGKLDILVNNATGSAGRDMAPPSTADLDVARQVIDVTLLGTWRITQAAIPLLGKSSCPRIVNVSSSAGLHSDPVLGLTGKAKAPPAYGIAKAALNALTACRLPRVYGHLSTDGGARRASGRRGRQGDRLGRIAR